MNTKNSYVWLAVWIFNVDWVKPNLNGMKNRAGATETADMNGLRCEFSGALLLLLLYVLNFFTVVLWMSKMNINAQNRRKISSWPQESLQFAFALSINQLLFSDEIWVWVQWHALVSYPAILFQETGNNTDLGTVREFFAEEGMTCKYTVGWLTDRAGELGHCAFCPWKVRPSWAPYKFQRLWNCSRTYRCKRSQPDKVVFLWCSRIVLFDVDSRSAGNKTTPVAKLKRSCWSCWKENKKDKIAMRSHVTPHRRNHGCFFTCPQHQ